MEHVIEHPSDANRRIVMTLDEVPLKPQDDGGFPIWRIERGHHGFGPVAAQERSLTSYVTPAELDEGITGAFNRAWTYEQVERYLRIFWGATFAQWWHSGSYQYVTCDPKHWREVVGVPDDVTGTDDYAAEPFKEFEAWVEGNVWVATEQHRLFVVTNRRFYDPAKAEDPDDPASSDEIDEVTTDGFEWNDGEQVGGFYGDPDDNEAAVRWNFGWDGDVTVTSPGTERQ